MPMMMGHNIFSATFYAIIKEQSTKSKKVHTKSKCHSGKREQRIRSLYRLQLHARLLCFCILRQSWHL